MCFIAMLLYWFRRVLYSRSTVECLCLPIRKSSLLGQRIRGSSYIVHACLRVVACAGPRFKHMCYSLNRAVSCAKLWALTYNWSAFIYLLSVVLTTNPRQPLNHSTSRFVQSFPHIDSSHCLYPRKTPIKRFCIFRTETMLEFFSGVHGSGTLRQITLKKWLHAARPATNNNLNQSVPD